MCIRDSHQHICIRKKTEIADSHTLYRNDDFSAVHEIQTYVDEVSRDLAAAINQYGAFCGDETARDDLHQAWYERGLELSNVCAIDVDNDGRDEYFERAGAFYSKGQMEMCIRDSFISIYICQISKFQ